MTTYRLIPVAVAALAFCAPATAAKPKPHISIGKAVCVHKLASGKIVPCPGFNK